MGYRRSAEVYDAVYGGKDYAGEAARVHEIIQARRPRARTLLEVACGTGRYLEHFRARYDVEGLDASREQLAVARERLPDVALHELDMRGFDLGRGFDAVACLFSSIGYAHSVAGLRSAVVAMAQHLVAGGVLVLEPWVEPDAWVENRVHMVAVDEPELKIARTNTTSRVGDLAVMDMHYLVGRPDGVEHFVERHELALYSREQYLDAFRRAELDVEHDPEGLIGRGLYVGVKRRSE